MLYVKSNGGLPCAISEEYPGHANENVKWGTENGWSTRNDWKTFDEVLKLSKYLTAMTGDPYLPVDNSASVSPRYDVVKAPKVGDKVSYGFNGDYTPDGEVVKISKTYQVTTSTGRVYRRRGNSGSWLQSGGTWGLTQGHIFERNPSF